MRLLRKYLFSVIHQMISIGMPLDNVLFQQDKAPVYKAYNAMDWLKRNSLNVMGVRHTKNADPEGSRTDPCVPIS